MKSLKKWLQRIVYGVVFATLCYYVFSKFFDTPIEYSLKQSNTQLRQRLDELTASLDSLSHIISDIERRDSSIYELVFEAKYSNDSNSLSRNTISIDSLNNLTNRELSAIFNAKLATLDYNVTIQSSSMASTLRHIDSNAVDVNKIPSIQPVNNRNLNLLGASYGYRIHPFYKTKHFHKGLDYSVPEGTAVFATADGTVSSIETKGQSGLTVTINHGDYKTKYSNLDKVLLNVGSRVMRGNIIAFSGNSGLSYAPHLHYEVLYKNKNVDPLPYTFAELDRRDAEELAEIASITMQSFD